MFRVEVYMKSVMVRPVVKYYKSLREASLDLGTSYYFLYNCYHRKHHNQFSSFFSVVEVDSETFLDKPYREPRVNNRPKYMNIVKNEPVSVMGNETTGSKLELKCPASSPSTSSTLATSSSASTSSGPASGITPGKKRSTEEDTTTGREYRNESESDELGKKQSQSVTASPASKKAKETGARKRRKKKHSRYNHEHEDEYGKDGHPQLGQGELPWGHQW